jgi:hypothetical protein
MTINLRCPRHYRKSLKGNKYTYWGSDLEEERESPCPCGVHILGADHGAGGRHTADEEAAVY